jgi:hypothetical protein
MMNKRFSKTEMKGLPGGPNQQFTYVTGVFLQDMYSFPQAQEGLETPDPMIKFNELARNRELQPIYPYQPMKKGKVENEAEEFLTKMVNSPLFEERYNKMRGYKTPASKEEIENYRNHMLSNMQKVDWWPVGFDRDNKKYDTKKYGSAWYDNMFTLEKDKYGVDIVPEDPQSAGLSSGKKSHTIFRSNNYDPTAAIHELSHASTNYYGLPANVNIPFSKNPEKEEYVKRFNTYHNRRNTEKKSYKDELAKYLYDAGIYDATTKRFDENDYENVIKEYEKIKEELKKDPNNKALLEKKKTFDRNIEPYDKEQTIQLFNSFVDNISNEELPIGKAGGEGYRIDAPDYNAPSKIIKGKKGKPTNITMTEQDGGALQKGPLLGIDNMGNQQMMFPGYNYVFPGDEVMEIPVAQNGKGNIKVNPFANVFPINEEGYKALTGEAGLSTNIKNKPTFINTSIRPTFGYSPYDPQKKYNLDLKGSANVGYRVGDFTTELGVLKDLQRSKNPQVQAVLGFNNEKLGVNARSTFPNKDNPNFNTGVNLRYSPTKNLSFTGDFQYDSKMNSPMFNVGATYKFLQNGGGTDEFQRILKKYTTKGWPSLTEEEKNFYSEMYRGNLPQVTVQADRPNPVIDAMREGRNKLSNEISSSLAEATGFNTVKKVVSNLPHYLGEGFKALEDTMLTTPVVDVPLKANYSDVADLAEAATLGSGIIGGGRKLIRPLNKYIKEIPGYINDIYQTSKNAGKFELPTYSNVYRWSPDKVPNSLLESGKYLTPEQKKLSGNWYSTSPDLGFYLRTRPGSGKVERFKIPDYKIKYLKENMSDAAKGMSGKNAIASSKTKHPDELLLDKLTREKYKKKNKYSSLEFKQNPYNYIDLSEINKKFIEDLGIEVDKGDNLYNTIFDKQINKEFLNPLFKQFFNTKKNTPYKKQGGEFQKLVNKYTTKGWQSLTDQEKQTYKEMYKQYK